MRTDVGTFNLKVFESNQTRIDFSSSHIKFFQGLNLLHLISNTLSSQFTTKRLLNEQIKDTLGATILYLVKSKVSWLLCGCPEKAVCLFNQGKQLNVRQSLVKRL